MKTSKSVLHKQKCFKNMFINLKQLCKKFIYFPTQRKDFLLSGIALHLQLIFIFYLLLEMFHINSSFLPFAKQKKAKWKSKNEVIKVHFGKIMLYKIERINTGTESRTVSGYWVTNLPRKVLVLARVTLPKQITWLLAVRW